VPTLKTTCITTTNDLSQVTEQTLSHYVVHLTLIRVRGTQSTEDMFVPKDNRIKNQHYNLKSNKNNTINDRI
jgi:hypothetical protein